MTFAANQRGVADPCYATPSDANPYSAQARPQQVSCQFREISRHAIISPVRLSDDRHNSHRTNDIAYHFDGFYAATGGTGDAASVPHGEL